MLYTPKNQKIFLAYALHNDAIFKKLTEYHVDWQSLVIETLSCVSSSSKQREMIVSLYLGKEHNSSINGPDCLDKLGQPDEIKNEQRTNVKLEGMSSWHYTSELNMSKYLSQKCYLGGWTNKGRLVYLVSWDIKETNLIERMIQNFKSGKTKNAVKFEMGGWNKLNSTELHFLNESYFGPEYMSGPLMDTLDTLAAEFQDTADII